LIEKSLEMPYEQAFYTYSRLVEIDEMFREEQISSQKRNKRIKDGSAKS